MQGKLNINQTIKLLITVYFSNPLKFKDAFAKRGIEIEGPQDLVELAKLSVSGNDKRSVCASTSHCKEFNTLEIIENIKLSKAEMLKGKKAYMYMAKLEEKYPKNK